MTNKFLSPIHVAIEQTRKTLIAQIFRSPDKAREALRLLISSLTANPAFKPMQPPPSAIPRHTPIIVDEAFELDRAGVEMQASGAKALLLEVLRRAAYDWVLYRHSIRPQQRKIANDAQVWLFEEREDYSPYGARHVSKHMTSFLEICSLLDLDPAKVRARVRELTPKHVTNVGRPVEYRKLPKEDESGITTHYSSVPLYSLDVDSD